MGAAPRNPEALEAPDVLRYRTQLEAMRGTASCVLS